MKIKTLDRIERAKYAWETAMFVLEVADFVSRGAVRSRLVRAIHDAGRPKTFEMKRPAEYTIKVKSERG